jgi:hypothetical protein
MRWAGHVALFEREKERERRSYTDLWWGNLRKGGNLADLGRIILKCIFKMLDVEVWTGFI